MKGIASSCPSRVESPKDFLLASNLNPIPTLSFFLDFMVSRNHLLRNMTLVAAETDVPNLKLSFGQNGMFGVGFLLYAFRK